MEWIKKQRNAVTREEEPGSHWKRRPIRQVTFTSHNLELEACAVVLGRNPPKAHRLNLQLLLQIGKIQVFYPGAWRLQSDHLH